MYLDFLLFKIKNQKGEKAENNEKKNEEYKEYKKIYPAVFCLGNDHDGIGFWNHQSQCQQFIRAYRCKSVTVKPKLRYG